MEQQKLLELIEYHLDELKLDRTEGDAEESDASAASVDPGVQVESNVSVDFDLFTHRENPKLFAVGLTVSAKGEEATPTTAAPAVSVTIRLVGIFEVSEGLSGTTVPVPLAVNGLTILYGIARGIVSTAAAWFNTPILLPTVYFSNLVRAKYEEARSVAELAHGEEISLPTAP